MARAGKRAHDRVADGAWKPTRAVDEPILNGPYDEPSRHWAYVEDDDGIATPIERPGRRPVADKLELPERLREDVGRWRNSGYRGASQVTRELLRYWFDPGRTRRLFFCQREAVETIIYLLELAIPGRLAATGCKNFKIDAVLLGRLLRGEDCGLSPVAHDNPVRLIDRPDDPSLLPLTRLGLRMATGSGKTLVMAMIITWAFTNRAVYPSSTHFPSAVLICAPNLTVKTRLQVLRPDHPHSDYRRFDLVPAKYADLLQQGRVLVTNWHAFAPRSAHREGDRTYKVVDKGDEPNHAFLKGRLGELARRLPILVMNDEGHHCWRPRKLADATVRGKQRRDDEAEEARVWLAGLDRINNAGLLDDANGEARPCILAAIDLSATPFYLAASGYPEGSPFPWLVTSFGLMDAIESGIVKVPRLPVLADRTDPRYVQGDVDDAVMRLAREWKASFDAFMLGSIGEDAAPPVMIIVCENTTLADRVFNKVSGESVREVVDEQGKSRRVTVYARSEVLDELANAEGVRQTVRIDSRLLEKLERADGVSRDEAALALRTVIDTVGKPGQPGQHVRCVVSVAMLTEGWDANNVTHILGLRAFGSQLLCEQVVGRGLRRRRHDVGADGKLPPEYVDVHGIPFSLVPFKGQSAADRPTDGPQHRVFAMPGRAHLEIRMPVVEGFIRECRDCGIHCDVERLPVMPVMPVMLVERQAGEEPERLQAIVFGVAQRIVEELIAGSAGQLARHLVFPAVVRILHEYIDRRVQFAVGVDRRALGHEPYLRLLRERVRSGILLSTVASDAPLLPIVNRFSEYYTTASVDGLSDGPVRQVSKCHLNVVVLRGRGGGIGDDAVIDILEGCESVEAFAPNDRQIGFAIAYEHLGELHRHTPDFIVRLHGGKHVMLEIAGGEPEAPGDALACARQAAVNQWIAAVNNTRRYGQWAFEIVGTPAALRAAVVKHAGELQGPAES